MVLGLMSGNSLPDGPIDIKNISDVEVSQYLCELSVMTEAYEDNFFDAFYSKSPPVSIPMLNVIDPRISPH